MVVRSLATLLLLLVQSSSIEPKRFGSGYKPEPAQRKRHPSPATRHFSYLHCFDFGFLRQAVFHGTHSINDK